MNIYKRGTAVKITVYVQHPAHFSRATSPSLVVWLYLAYSKLLKLTPASIAGVYFTYSWYSTNIWSITDECLITILYDRLSLSHLSWRRRRRRRRNKRCPLMNGAATHEWTIVYDASHRSYVEDKLTKNISALYLVTPKDIAVKSGETHVRDRALPSCKFSLLSALIGDSPGGYRPMLCMFGKLSSSQCDTVFEIFAVKIWDFGAFVSENHA